MLKLYIAIYVLSSVSATFIVVNSKLFEGWRKFMEKYTTLFRCSLCFGFWASLLNGNWMWAIYTGYLPSCLLLINVALCGSLLAYTFDFLTKKYRF